MKVVSSLSNLKPQSGRSWSHSACYLRVALHFCNFCEYFYYCALVPTVLLTSRDIFHDQEIVLSSVTCPDQVKDEQREHDEQMSLMTARRRPSWSIHAWTMTTNPPTTQEYQWICFPRKIGLIHRLWIIPSMTGIRKYQLIWCMRYFCPLTFSTVLDYPGKTQTL